MTNVKGEFLKSPEFYWALHPGVNNVFTAVKQDDHRYFRRLLTSGISESGLRGYTERIEPKHRAAIAGMREEMQQRGAADVQKWWVLMTYDVLNDLVFGEATGVLEHGEVCPDSTSFHKICSGTFANLFLSSFRSHSPERPNP